MNLKWDRLKRNYFFSFPSWIANLGVVPLILFWAFRLAPDFFNLLFLLFLVTVVFDIIYLLKNLSLYIIHKSYQSITYVNLISNYAHFVKAGTCALFCIVTNINFIYADVPRSKTVFENRIISIGEHFELKATNLKKFTIANNDILSHKLFPRHRLLIKGKKIGFSEVIVWNQNGTKKISKVYVLSKKGQMQIVHLGHVLKSIGLEVEITGHFIICKGEITSIKDYQLVHKLLRISDKLHITATISQKVRNDIIAEVYRMFFDAYIDQIKCQFRGISINCLYPKSNAPSKNILTYLKNTYFVNLIAINNTMKGKNFRAKLKVIQMERMDGLDLNFGINGLTSSLNDFFTLGMDNIIKKNIVLLKETGVEISTLAEPETIIKIGDPATIELGANMPYKSKQVNNIAITSWKFAGLRVKLELSTEAGGLKITYSSELTRPDKKTNKITGSKGSSSCNIDIDNPLIVFQIGLRTIGKSKEGIPGIMNLPFLGSLFRSSNTTETYKQITGILVLEEYE